MIYPETSPVTQVSVAVCLLIRFIKAGGVPVTFTVLLLGVQGAEVRMTSPWYLFAFRLKEEG